MPDYRAYLIDRHGHIVAPATIIVAEEDASALEEAKKYVDGHDVEVWEGVRRIGVLKHAK